MRLGQASRNLIESTHSIGAWHITCHLPLRNAHLLDTTGRLLNGAPDSLNFSDFCYWQPSGELKNANAGLIKRYLPKAHQTKLFRMKTLTWLFFIAFLPVITAFHYSAGYQKNLLSNGLSFRYNGFAVKTVILVDSSNKVMEDNKVGLNSQVSIVALGMSNFELKQGKSFPGMMLSVTDQAGLAVIDEAD